MLRNESVQLTIAEGRITSLVDVQLGSVITSCSDDTAEVVHIVVSSSQLVLPVVSSCSTTGQITGMLGVGSSRTPRSVAYRAFRC